MSNDTATPTPADVAPESVLIVNRYKRKPFFVDAVQVEEGNVDQIAKWCRGSVKTTDAGVKYVKVHVYRPLGERQTRAYVGDWVLRAGTGFKVYTDTAMQKCFDKEEA